MREAVNGETIRTKFDEKYSSIKETAKGVKAAASNAFNNLRQRGRSANRFGAHHGLFGGNGGDFGGDGGDAGGL